MPTVYKSTDLATWLTEQQYRVQATDLQKPVVSVLTCARVQCVQSETVCELYQWMYCKVMSVDPHRFEQLPAAALRTPHIDLYHNSIPKFMLFTAM